MKGLNDSLDDLGAVSLTPEELSSFEKGRSNNTISSNESYPDTLDDLGAVSLTKMEALEGLAKTTMGLKDDIKNNAEKTIHNGKEEMFRQLSKKEKNGIVSDLLKVFVKSPLKGAGKAADMMTTDPYNFAADTSKETIKDDRIANRYLPFTLKSENVKPIVNPEGFDRTNISFKGAMERSADALTGGMTDSEFSETGKKFHLEEITSGMELLSQLATPGAISKLAAKYGWNGISKIAGFLGSTNPKVLAGAFAFGATDKALENDTGTLERLGLSTGAALGTEAALTAVAGGIKNPQKALKPVASLLGLGKNRLDVEAVDAGKRIGVDLFPAAVTDAPQTALGQQVVNKTPVFGNYLKKSVDETTKQYQSAFDRMLDKVAPKLEREFEEQANLIYAPTKKLIRPKDMVDYSSVIEGAKKLKYELKSPNKSEPTKALEKYLDEIIEYTEGAVKKADLPQGFDKMPKNIQQKVLGELKQGNQNISVAEALRHKIELNKIMRDRNIFDRIDTDSQALLKIIKRDVDRALMKYGNQHNKAWLESLKKSDLEYGKMAKRKNLEEALLDKVYDATTGNPKYNGLIKALSNPKSQKFLKNSLGQEQYNSLKDFIKVGQALDRVNRNIPNPSGTAIVSSSIGLLTSIWNFGLTPNLAGGAAGAGLLTYLLKSKEFVKTATKFAKNPTDPLAKRLEKIVKENTGLTIQAVIKQITAKEDSSESFSE